MPSWFVSWCRASEQGRQMLLGCSFSMPQTAQVRIVGLAMWRGFLWVVLTAHGAGGCQRSLFGVVAMGPRGGFVLNRSFWPAGKIALAGKIAFLTLGLNTREPTFKISGLPAGYAVRVEVVKPGGCVLGLVARASTWPPQTCAALAVGWPAVFAGFPVGACRDSDG